MSLALGGFGLIRRFLPRYRTQPMLVSAPNSAVATASGVGPRL
jgi:hypothetical protein